MGRPGRPGAGALSRCDGSSLSLTSLCPHGWSSPPVLPGDPNPAVFIPSGLNRVVAVNSSHDIPDTSSAIAPATTNPALE